MEWDDDAASRIEKINRQFMELLEASNAEVSSMEPIKFNFSSSNSSDYRINLIEEKRKFNEVPRHAFAFTGFDNATVDMTLNALYEKRHPYTPPEIIEVPVDMALKVKRDPIDILFSDVNFTKSFRFRR